MTTYQFNETIKSDFFNVTEAYSFGVDADFEQVAKWAEDNDFELRLIYKRDGGQWKDIDKAWEAIEPKMEDFGDDFHFESGDDNEFLLEMAKDIADECESVSDIIEKLEPLKEIEEQLELAGDDEWVITNNGKFYERIGKKLMSYNYDVHHYMVVAVK